MHQRAAHVLRVGNQLITNAEYLLTAQPKTGLSVYKDDNRTAVFVVVGERDHSWTGGQGVC